MKIAALVVVLMLVLAGGYLFWLGAFAQVKVAEKQAGPYLIVFQKQIGDYKNVGAAMDDLFYDLQDNFGLATTKGFGLYFDKPGETPTEELRSIVGVIVADKTAEELTKLPEKYGVTTFPESNSVVAELPYKGQMSIMLGVFKAYPRISEYVAEKGYGTTPIMEIYDQPNQILTYIVPHRLPQEVFSELLE